LRQAVPPGDNCIWHSIPPPGRRLSKRQWPLSDLFCRQVEVGIGRQSDPARITQQIDEWWRSDFSDMRNTPLLKPLAAAGFTTQAAREQELCCAEDQLCNFVAMGQINGPISQAALNEGCP